jgi:hypothetical protein
MSYGFNGVVPIVMNNKPIKSIMLYGLRSPRVKLMNIMLNKE